MVQISIDLDETLFRRLQAQAERDQKSIVQVMIDALQDNNPADTPTSPHNALLMIAEAAEALGDMSQSGDVAERSQ
jgi:ATP-dependent protease HslVU (ClpYQ) peptidase subunit